MNGHSLEPFYGWVKTSTSFTRILNVSIGDVIFLDDGINSEFAQIARIENTESINWAEDFKRKSFLKYKHLFLTKGLKNSYIAGWTPWRVYRNPAWEAFGTFKCTQDINPGDNTFHVDSTQVRLIPTVYAEGNITEASFLPHSDIDTYTFGVPSYYWTFDNILRPWRMINISGLAGSINFFFICDGKPIIAGTLSIWVRKEGRLEFLQDDGLGAFTANSWGSGSIDYDTGLVIGTFSEAPDEGTRQMVQYQMDSPFKPYTDINIGTGGSLPVALDFNVSIPIQKYGILINFEDADGYTWYSSDNNAGSLYWDRNRWFPSVPTWTTPANIASWQTTDGYFYDPFTSNFHVKFGITFYRSTNGSSWVTEATTSPIGSLGSFVTNNAGTQLAGTNSTTGSGPYIYRTGLGAWTSGTVGTNGKLYAAGYVASGNYWIFVNENGFIFYSTNNCASFTAGGQLSGLGGATITIGISDKLNRMMVAGPSGNMRVWDFSYGLPINTNWQKRDNYALSGTVRDACWDDETDRWFFVGDSCSATMSDDFGVTWTTLNTTFSDLFGASAMNLECVETDRRGRIIVLAHARTDLLYSADGGDTWLKSGDLGLPTSPANMIYNPRAIFNWTQEVMLVWYAGTSTYSAWKTFETFFVKEMTGLTDDIIGTVDYDAGTGELQYGVEPVGSIIGEYYVTNKDLKTLAVFLNGATDIVEDTFRIRVNRTNEARTLMEIYESGGVLVGDGTGTLYKENGYGNVTFDYEFDPDTIRVDYSFFSIVVTEFEFNYDLIDRTLFPADGYVPGMKTGDMVVIYDKTNPKKSLNFDQGSWDMVTWTNSDGGDPGPGEYDFISYPMTFFEAGTTTDRWAIYIKSVTTPDLLYIADIYQESQGATPVLTDQQVGTNAAGDLTVLNPVTGIGYWTLSKDGWGADWAIGNILRINTAANDDMLVVLDVYRDRFTTIQTASNDYLAANTHISNAVTFGDMVSGMGVSFDQNTWNTVTWLDTQQGAAAPANYNWATYSMVMTNAGAITERWGIFFTSIITPNLEYEVSVYSELHGVLLANQRIGPAVVVGGDLAPLNPATAVPFWTMRNDGWGAGWAVNNLVRFNTIGADKPVWIVRVINSRSSAQIDDSTKIQVRGDVS